VTLRYSACADTADANDLINASAFQQNGGPICDVVQNMSIRLADSSAVLRARVLVILGTAIVTFAVALIASHL
jgi:hypothetical protein